MWVLFGAESGFFGSLKIKSSYFLRLMCLFSGSLFNFRFKCPLPLCWCMDQYGEEQWIWCYGKGKKKKKMQEERVQRERREKQNPKKEDKNCEKRQITTWHVFIGWHKSNVLRQFLTKFKLILIYELMSIRSKTFQNYLIRSLKLT